MLKASHFTRQERQARSARTRDLHLYHAAFDKLGFGDSLLGALRVQPLSMKVDIQRGSSYYLSLGVDLHTRVIKVQMWPGISLPVISVAKDNRSAVVLRF